MTLAAVITAAAMIAEQIGGKAVRDALFLSRFPVTALPLIILATAVLSILFALAAARILTAHGPHRTIPVTFAGSALLLLVLWALGSVPKGQAVGVYLHVSVLGMVQISGFWSLINESYDPRSAKKRIGRIAAGATLGGLAGGLLAERIGSAWGISATLPALAVLHAVCAIASLRLRPLATGPAIGRQAETAPARAQEGGTRLGLHVLSRISYLRSLAALVLLTTLAAAFVDYVFKMEATQRLSGTALLRLFAVFYTAVGLVTFAVQTIASRRVLERFGLVRAVAALPFGVAAGSLGALMAPSPVSAGIARGLENILHNSLYRSGYEVLFSPLPAREKRAAKAIVDVGVERVGDAIAAGTVQLVLLVAAVMTAPLLLGLAIVCSVAGLGIARRLHSGYVATLERSLVSRAAELHLPTSDVAPITMDLHATLAEIAWAGDSAAVFPALRAASDEPPVTPTGASSPADSLLSHGPRPSADPLFRRLLDLRSAEPSRVRRAILEAGPVDRAVAPHVIQLLAWVPVADAAAQALRASCAQIVGQLVDSLTDPEEDFAIRRRIPSLLSESTSPIAVEGLLQGLLDQRFEVRYRCGRALVRIQEGVGHLPFEADRIYLPVLRELAVDRRVWESRKILDLAENEGESPFVDQLLRERVSRNLEHIFNVLSLALPRQSLQIAFRGLHADDLSLRGTALEYLESILPTHVWDALRPVLEDPRPIVPAHRSREEILADLMRSNESIAMDLEMWSRRHEGS